METDLGRIYRHTGHALLRATRLSTRNAPRRWPDLTGDDANVQDWRSWLLETWRDDTADAITLASPSLARRVEEIRAGRHLKPRKLRSVVASVVRYVLRETARPTPFGLFAGVTAVEFAAAAKVRWNEPPRGAARADAEWLDDVISRLERLPCLLDRLTVTISNLASVRGDRLVLPTGAGQVDVRYTAAVQAVWRAAPIPTRFGSLAALLAAEFPDASQTMIHDLLGELVTRRFLVTCLRAPATVIDPLAHVIGRLDAVDAHELVEVTATAAELRGIHADLDHHNNVDASEQASMRAQVVRRMSGLSQAARTPVAVDLHLDCEVALPDRVARDLQAAASVLLRLTPEPGGSRAWRDYRAAFLDRYGTGTLVAVTDLIDPDTGLGFPARYPGSTFAPTARPARTDRDDRLLTLVHRATLTGSTEIVLDDDAVRCLAGPFNAQIPAHVELSARIHAESTAALDRGDYTLTVSPARAAGTMTGRFTPGTGTGLARVFADLPTINPDAIPAQLSFPPAYPHAQNISRTPRFLPDIIALGEHRDTSDNGVIELADLAVTADSHQLHLVSLSLKRPVEPQVFHALRLDKQPPPIARFLANLTRGSIASYTEFDWGAAAGLAYLPRVRYGRCVLSPARWQINVADLPAGSAEWREWRTALQAWADRWRLPKTIELRDADRMLRLDMTEPTQAGLLRSHLDHSGHAVLIEAGDPAGCGWLDGHAHEIAIPLVSAEPPARSPLAGRSLIQVTNRTHGHLPGSAEWLFVKLYAHPDRQSDLIACHLPRLLAGLDGDPEWWFLRFRSLDEQDHLRLRIRVAGTDGYGASAAALGAWTAALRHEGLISRMVLDTYYPEVGRYGDGPAMAAAETVFAADSQVVLAQLRHIPPAALDPTALTVANIVDIARGFLTSTEAAMGWLIDHPGIHQAIPIPRPVARRAIWATDENALTDIPGWDDLTQHWDIRRAALAAYRAQLPTGANADNVLASVLHLHHNRAAGPDRDNERTCLRLARSAALAWRARQDPS
jgi:lantibiotic biosynthesis protein